MGQLRGRDYRRARRVLLVIGSLLVALMGSQSVAASNIESVFADFTHLDRLLTRAIDRAEKGESVASLLSQIKQDKLAIVDEQMTAPIDGVKGSTWFRDLEAVDLELQLAKLAEDGTAFRQKDIATFLEHAKQI